MLHKPKLLLTNANVIINERSLSTINEDIKPMRGNKRFKTHSYNSLYDEIFKNKHNEYSKKDIFVNNKYNIFIFIVVYYF